MNDWLRKVLTRVVEGRSGRGLDPFHGSGPTEPFITGGLCHINGPNYWGWEGKVIWSEHGRVHLVGCVQEYDTEDEPVGSPWEYNRTLEIH